MRTEISLKCNQKLELSLETSVVNCCTALYMTSNNLHDKIGSFSNCGKRNKNLGYLCLLSLAWFRSFNAFGGSEGLFVSMSCPCCTRGAEKQNCDLKNPETHLIVECPELCTWFPFEFCIKMSSKDLITSKPLLKALTGDTQGGKRPSKPWSCSPKWSFCLHGHTMAWKKKATSNLSFQG